MYKVKYGLAPSIINELLKQNGASKLFIKKQGFWYSYF